MSKQPKTQSEETLATSTAAAEWMLIEAVRKWERNPKRRSPDDIREAMGSLRRFGFCAPMVVWGSRQMLVAGHARLTAMEAILAEDGTLSEEVNDTLRASLTGPSARHVPVRVREFRNMGEAEAYALRDNNDFGSTDSMALADIVRDLQADGIPTEGLGWSDSDLAKMLGGQPERGDPNGTSFDENAGDSIKTVDCPHCGGRVPV